MSAGSTRDRHVSGRRQNDESEPFLVQQIPGSPVQRGRRRADEDDDEEERFPVQRIPGSPVQRGRRRHDEEERFPVQRIPGSPVQRGRRRHDEEERFLVDDMTGSPIARGRVTRVTPATTTTSIGDAVDGSAPSPSAPTAGYVDAIGRSPIPPPDNDDAPPSYESSIPPSQIGWASEIVGGPTIPFPMPFANVTADDGRSANVFSYPPQDAYPPIGLSPLAKSYQSLDTSKSRSPIRSTSPSLCPSPDRCRPAYTYQHLRVATPPPRPRFDSDSARFVVKPQNDFSYKYGAIVIAIAFVAFLMLLSLAVKFLIRNSFRQ